MRTKLTITEATEILGYIADGLMTEIAEAFDRSYCETRGLTVETRVYVGPNGSVAIMEYGDCGYRGAILDDNHEGSWDIRKHFPQYFRA